MTYPMLVSNFRTPKIVWYQSDVTVTIRILLQDIDDYYLRVECDHLLFSTTKNMEDYYLCLYLFGTVVAEKTTHQNLGREIKITLRKAHKWTGWLRLQIEKDRNTMIVPDPDHVFGTDWSESPVISDAKETIAEYKDRNNISYIMPVVPSSDEEESDDELKESLYL